MKPGTSSIVPGNAGESALDHVSDRLPGTAVELHQPHLFDGTEIRRSSIDRNARQPDRTLVSLQRRRLPHDVLARKIVAALAQYLRERFGRGVSVQGIAILLV